MKNTYAAPTFQSDGFNCPHCGAFAAQSWYIVKKHDKFSSYDVKELQINTCQRCFSNAFWLDEKMLYPVSSVAPLPSEDMPEDVEEDFTEARNIVNLSPRAACALLRLATQRLMIQLGEKGKNINDDIGNLVKKGLPEKMQKAFDSVRVIGNNAIHPGEINLKDDIKTAIALFGLINMIIDVMIIQPKKVEEIFNKIPEGAKEAIKKRNKTE